MQAQKTERSNIKGWGADLDPRNRPAVPKERTPPRNNGAHWDEPERQVPRIKVLVSTEHKGLTPVFGTSCPPKGLSGLIRQWAFKYSEGKKAHWLLLLLADRVDVVESQAAELFKGQLPHPFQEMGLKSEFKRGGFFSRFGDNRSDVRRQGLELVLFLGAGAYLASRLIKRRAA